MLARRPDEQNQAKAENRREPTPAAAILGQALLLWRPVLLTYAVVVAAAVVTFVLTYEQPTLTRQFGDEYTAYRRAVPAWRPRLTPWRREDEH